MDDHPRLWTTGLRAPLGQGPLSWSSAWLGLHLLYSQARYPVLEVHLIFETVFFFLPLNEVKSFIDKAGVGGQSLHVVVGKLKKKLTVRGLPGWPSKGLLFCGKVWMFPSTGVTGSNTATCSCLGPWEISLFLTGNSSWRSRNNYFKTISTPPVWCGCVSLWV